MKSLPRLEDVYDPDDMTCEKHPNKKWPHKQFNLKIRGPIMDDCPGPGIPRKKRPTLNNPTEAVDNQSGLGYNRK